QGGYYFNGGPFTLPMDGALSVGQGWGPGATLYRFFLSDAINFRSHIRLGMEAFYNNEDDFILAYYYFKPQPSEALSDSLDVGNALSETAHSFSMSGQTWSGSLTNTFYGTFKKDSITASGKADTGSSEFVLAIQSANSGVIVRRMFDQKDTFQQAAVYIDGSLAGTWYHAGANPYHRWCEDEFMVPAKLTNGKSSVRVKLVAAAGKPAWNAYKYWAFTLAPASSLPTSVAPRLNSERTKSPEITINRYSISIPFASAYEVRILRPDGRLVKTLKASAPAVFMISDQKLKAGFYIVNVSTGRQKISKTMMAY
ncbi:MAG: DUF2961 domain-containing protein, partial [Chitinivibrionales bacterium]|nr:DUF2961 domain-containing protein [Chitinivibrionales bacterium]